MTIPTPPTNGAEPITLEEIRDLLTQTAETAAENTRAIAEMRAANAERYARHDREMAAIRAANAERDARHDKEMAAIRAANAERDARHDKEMAAIREAIDKLTIAQDRTNQEVSTLKGWGLEIYCERNPDIFADALSLGDEELIPKREIRRIAKEARLAGFITLGQARSLGRADVFIYARRGSDHRPFCLVVEASFEVKDDDVDRAADRAEILDIVLQKYQPRHLNGQVIPIVAGTRISPSADSKLKYFNVTYVPVQNGNQLTNPPE